MPQSRHKVPFSGKAKKQQLKEKRQRQQNKNDPSQRRNAKYLLTSNSEDYENEEGNVISLNKQPITRSGIPNPNRYNLRFHRETEAELKERKEQARKTIVPVSEECLEINLDDYFPTELSFPVRPVWDFSLSKEQLDSRENKYFSEYLKKIEEKFKLSELSYFELNLETWRQLWRVLEMSDIILLITDIRFPALMFPPSLYEYVTDYLEKDIIVVLNKIDLAPSPLVLAWKHYLRRKYPGIYIVMFTSFPSYNLRGTEELKKEGLQVRRRRGKMRMAAEGAQKLLDCCKDLVNDQVDLTSWQEKINEEKQIENDLDEEDIRIEETFNMKYHDTSFYSYDRFANGILTIGCVGQPNVGKSSLMNALMGKKVVSVSRTPGHTKHFQTIFLTKNVKLCDCPGLVFPSKVPKSLQILMGSFPIAQLREPYSCVQYLAERVDLISLLKIEHPDLDDEWSAMDICDGWAKKKSYYTAKAARLDSYRAANHLLRMALEGKIPICLRPLGYTANKAKWESHPDIQVVEWIQAASSEHSHLKKELSLSEESDGESYLREPTQGASGFQGQDSGPESSEEDSDNTVPSQNKFLALDLDE